MRRLSIVITGEQGAGKSTVGRLVRDTLESMGFETTLADAPDKAEQNQGPRLDDRWGLSDERYDHALQALSGELGIDVRTECPAEKSDRAPTDTRPGCREFFVIRETDEIPYPDGYSVGEDLPGRWYGGNLVPFIPTGIDAADRRLESYARTLGWDGMTKILVACS